MAKTENFVNQSDYAHLDLNNIILPSGRIIALCDIGWGSCPNGFAYPIFAAGVDPTVDRMAQPEKYKWEARPKKLNCTDCAYHKRHCDCSGLKKKP